MKNKRPRLLGLWVGISLALVFLPICLRPLLRKSKTWQVGTQVGGKPAVVRITWTLDRGIRLGHMYIVGGGNWEYSTEVAFYDGSRLQFDTTSQPVGLWQLEGAYYVACHDAGAGWSLGRLKNDGSVASVSPGDLPAGPRPWNLESPWDLGARRTVEGGGLESWEESFQRWLKWTAKGKRDR